MSVDWTAAVLPAAIAAAAIAALLRTRLAKVLVDHPNARSLHDKPTPRLGGIGLMAGALGVAALHAAGPLWIVLGCALALSLVSALDDWRSLPVGVRLTAHALAAAGVALASGAYGAWGVGAAIGLALAIVWMTNLYNFMDGSDALAGLMALIGFAALAIAAAAAGQAALAIACAATASAAAGFLAFNWPPARVFMGDAGSVPLGFLAAALGAHGALEGAWPAWFPALVFSPFIVDATITIGKRLARGERIWIAHRGHYYQRLVLGGWSARRLALGEALLMLAAAASALYALRAGQMLQCGILLGWLALYGILVAAIETRRDAKNK